MSPVRERIHSLGHARQCLAITLLLLPAAVSPDWSSWGSVRVGGRDGTVFEENLRRIVSQTSRHTPSSGSAYRFGVVGTVSTGQSNPCRELGSATASNGNLVAVGVELSQSAIRVGSLETQDFMAMKDSYVRGVSWLERGGGES